MAGITRAVPTMWRMQSPKDARAAQNHWLQLCGIMMMSLAAAALAAAADPPANGTSFPTLFPPWPPVWTLHRSTIAMPCNYSGWFDPELAAAFGVVSFDWANHENSWRSRASEINTTSNDTECALPHPTTQCFYPDADDLVTQAKMVKAVNPDTKTWVYRQGQGAGSPSGRQARALLTDPTYDGFFLTSVGCPPDNASCGALPKGTRVGPYDFRNDTLVDYFINDYVGGPDCLGNADVDGVYLDDVSGLGSPGTPDATSALKQSGLSHAEAARWNDGQRRAVIGAQKAAVSKHNAFTWQSLQPMLPGGGVGMVSPDKASCLNGGPDRHTGVGFAGLRNMCSPNGGKLVSNIPFFMEVWAERDEMASVLGHGSCTEKADCALDTCKHMDPRGGVNCSRIPNIRERLAAFQLVRGPFAWIGYSWQGCAGTDHRRPYFEFPGGPYKCPQNASLRCSGYTDGARWLAPNDWDAVATLDFGGDQAPVDEGCSEVAEGVFERRFKSVTVRLDCNTFTASFDPR